MLFCGPPWDLPAAALRLGWRWGIQNPSLTSLTGTSARMPKPGLGCWGPSGRLILLFLSLHWPLHGVSSPGLSRKVAGPLTLWLKLPGLGTVPCHLPCPSSWRESQAQARSSLQVDYTQTVRLESGGPWEPSLDTRSSVFCTLVFSLQL